MPERDPAQGIIALIPPRKRWDIDDFVRYLYSNVLRYGEVAVSDWRWVVPANFIPFPRKQAPRVLARNLYDM